MDNNKQEFDSRFKSADSFPSDLVISGKFLMHQKEHREWTKDGETKQMDVDCLYLQDGTNMFIVRCFNPTVDLDLFPVGAKVYIPVQEYRKENGLKTFVARI